MKFLAFITIVFCAIEPQDAAAGQPDTAIPNPSAEQVASNGSPEGWGLYVGAGGLKVTSSSDEKRSGERAACIELTNWYVPPGSTESVHQGTISGALMLAPNNGYGAGGALPCRPGVTYAFSFWYKGNIANASVGVTGWPSADAGDDKRIRLAVLGGEMTPGTEWQKCTGRFRIPDGVQRFALGIYVSSHESNGGTLGAKLYIDDADVRSRGFPDGELRAIWGPLPEGPQREDGLRQIQASLDKIKSGGFNTLFVWTTSQYLAALDQPELQKAEPKAAWDALGEMIREAKQRSLQVHLWYSPWIYKDKSRAVELQCHPEWAAVRANGAADAEGVCFVRPEVRQFELQLITKAINRYADLAGIHIEEPGFNWGNDFCYCDYCRAFCQREFGIDIRQEPHAAKPTIHSLAPFMCTDFFLRLRKIMNDQRPEMWLSANGGSGDDSEWYIGRDWHTWARRGLIDFYVPQLYTKDVAQFTADAEATKRCLAGCDMVAGMAVSWSGIHPAKQPPEVIQAEILAARKLGAKGFAVYYVPFLQDEHYQAIRKAIDGQVEPDIKP